jgi:predicted Kef-type K+ transport protein
MTATDAKGHGEIWSFGCLTIEFCIYRGSIQLQGVQVEL